MDFIFIQALNGLASAASLFLVASGLSIIFGVTRITNFAHGAFYMLGAYVAFTLTSLFSGALGFWGGIMLASMIVAALGSLIEIVLLRRIYHVPELFQLLATFGITLVMQDLVVMIWGPDDFMGPRAPGFQGAVKVLDHMVPSYDFFLIGICLTVLASLWLLLHHTRWGMLVRAATQDREMLAALGINQKWLFTSVFTLGVFLAALGGALQIPRTTVSHSMDLSILVETFVVVVIGGLGSIPGAFIAAILVSEFNAFGILWLPQVSLVSIFLIMAIVLILRPQGLLGKSLAPPARTFLPLQPWKPLSRLERLLSIAVVAGAAGFPFLAGSYGLSIATEILIFVLFAVSLHFIMAVGGLNSFGHAAYFGLGAYGASLFTSLVGTTMEVSLLMGTLLGLLGSTIFGWLCVRLSGVYFAMLTLGFAQITWSIAFQWVEVTGGDNGKLGIWPTGWASNVNHFYWLTLSVTVVSIIFLRTLIFSPFGYALRATRDNALRAEAIGLCRPRLQWLAFVIAGTFAGLSGSLYAFLKGSVFPDYMAIPVSVDGLIMVLLGGLETVSGAIIGAIIYKTLEIWLISQTDLSRLIMGVVIIAIVMLFPRGINGLIEDVRYCYWPSLIRECASRLRIAK